MKNEKNITIMDVMRYLDKAEMNLMKAYQSMLDWEKEAVQTGTFCDIMSDTSTEIREIQHTKRRLLDKFEESA